MNDLYLAQLNEAVSMTSAVATISFTVPPNETWIVYSASLSNDADQAEPTVTQTPGGCVMSHIWPGVTAAPAADRAGQIVDAAFFPQVLSPGTTISIFDNAWSAGEILTFTMLFTRVAIDKTNRRLKQ